MAKERILVVDDEEDILELVRYNLSKEGYKVDCTNNGEQALSIIEKEPPDLVVLDLMLPGIDGFDVCKAIRTNAASKHIPIIMLTARSEEADVVTGLELGADDFVIKPFSPRVLSARVKTVLRRGKEKPSDDSSPLVVQELVINPARHEVTLRGGHLDLTHTEFKVLHLLARKRGFVFSRYQIVDLVHGDDYPVTDRSVDVQIVGLRKKLADYGPYIETVRGVGYKFKG